jgi:hypothetical protein
MIDLTLPMKPLSFNYLVNLGRASIPTTAPGWTDHNVSDPGIMLMELLAWIAEAQMYSLARMRKDERRAFAHMLAVEPRGPMPAQGLLWPLVGSDTAFPAGLVILSGAAATAARADIPTFFTSNTLQLTPAKLIGVVSRYANGVSHDWTRVNAQPSATFEPFGDASDAGVRLVLTFELSSSASPTADAPLSLGVEVLNASLSPSAKKGGQKLSITLSDANGERPLEILDTTSGLLESGVLLLDTGRISPAAGRFQLIVQSTTGGFERPPRFRRIAINVLPIQQLETVPEEEPTFGQGLPNQQYRLRQSGLVFTAKRKDAVTVTTLENGTSVSWKETENLQLSGPNDSHFELDTDQGILTFGNGLNGRLAPLGADLQVKYTVCAGVKGNIQPGAQWKVEGTAGKFENPEITVGGLDATTLDDLRDNARVQVDSVRPLVTAADVETAAKSFTDLGVTRAVELPYDARQPTGYRVLVVAGPQDDPSAPVLRESTEFLNAVRERILPRLPLGQRLQLIGPSYVQIGIKATLTAARNTDPNVVRKNAMAALQQRLATVTADGFDQWPLGRPVSVKSVQGWLRQVEGVAQVVSVELHVTGNAQLQSVVRLKPRELPSLQISEADLTVLRPAVGAANE